MKKTSIVRKMIHLTLFGMLFLFAFNACSNTADLETQVTGKWQRTQGNGVVDINLATPPKTLAFDGHAYNAEVESIDKGAYTIKVKVKLPSGQNEVWFIIQKWDDNGSSFNLAFRHNGTTETLVPASNT